MYLRGFFLTIISTILYVEKGKNCEMRNWVADCDKACNFSRQISWLDLTMLFGLEWGTLIFFAWTCKNLWSVILARLDMSDGFWVTSKKDELFFLVENNCQQTFFRFLFATFTTVVHLFYSVQLLNVYDCIKCQWWFCLHVTTFGEEWKMVLGGTLFRPAEVSVSQFYES